MFWVLGVLRLRGEKICWEEATRTDVCKIAQTALDQYKLLKRFTVASKPVDITNCHSGVFIPKDRESAYTFQLNNQNNTCVSYWDENAFASVHTVDDREYALVRHAGKHSVASVQPVSYEPIPLVESVS